MQLLSWDVLFLDLRLKEKTPDIAHICMYVGPRNNPVLFRPLKLVNDFIYVFFLSNSTSFEGHFHVVFKFKNTLLEII